MNVNNFNFFERHAEKITLAVVAAAAGCLIWTTLCSQAGTSMILPVETTVGSGNYIYANEVEPKITDAVDHLEKVRDETRRKEVSVAVDDYVRKYDTMMKNQPLPEYLVEARVASFGPRNLAVDSSAMIGPQQDVPVATPSVPTPTDLAAVSWRGVVVPEAPVGGGQPVQPVQPGPGFGPGGAGGAAAPSGVDKDLVLVKGVIDLNAMLKTMTDLPPAFQRTVICAVELRRRTRIANGWSDYQAVPPSPAVAPVVVKWSDIGDADLQSTVNGIEAQFKQIAQPEYYPLAAGGSIVQQLLLGLPGATTAPAPGAVPAAVPPAAGASASTQPTGPIPIWALDDSVEPGAEYQYQLRVVMYNPTYHWPRVLKDPAMKKQATIASAWADVPNAVDIKANMYVFFASSNLGAQPGPHVSATVYKWNAGKWYKASATTQSGLPIVASMKMGGVTSVNVPTGFTLVDVTVAPNGNDDIAVVMDSNGQLSTRSTGADWSNPFRQSLDVEVNKSFIPPAPTTRPNTLFPRPPVYTPPPPYTPTGPSRGGPLGPAPNDPSRG